MALPLERRPIYAARGSGGAVPAVDLLRLPVLGRFLRWRWSRTILQVPLFLLAAVLVWHGLFGPELAPKNLATLLTWVHFRGLLVLVLLVAGNFFCMGCPLLLSRDFARRFWRPRWNWPRRLRNKWLAVGLFVLILFLYELFGLWGNPVYTAWLIVAYFVGALAVDLLFKHASFCKWVCPIGQFNFLASTLSPLEVRVRKTGVCEGCQTKDCIRGMLARPAGGRRPLPIVSRRGCELALFQPMKVGNLDCTFCLDCVYACPHDNIGIMSRMPGVELSDDAPRSGVGQPSKRTDLAALALAFTFGALLNAFGMVSPVYVVEAWLSRALHSTGRTPVLSLLFAAGLVVEPLVLLALTSWATRQATGSRERLVTVATRYAYTLVPLGFGVWLAHYGFHFFTGLLTVVPVTQNATAELGWPVLGKPSLASWRLGGLPASVVFPMELGFLFLGMIGAWIAAVRIGRRDFPRAPWRAWAPWVVLHVVLWAAAAWLMTQPMEMRGTFLGS
jgi:polyferredoxin